MKNIQARKWWAVTEQFTVLEVTGYSCSVPTLWEVPELNSSMTENFNLFKTKAQALESAKREARLEIDSLLKLHDDLSNQTL